MKKKLFRIILILVGINLISVSCLDKVEDDPPKPAPPQPEWLEEKHKCK